MYMLYTVQYTVLFNKSARNKKDTKLLEKYRNKKFV